MSFGADLKFNAAFLQLMNLEGGWSDSGIDKGGKTKYGISSKYYPKLDLDSITLDGAKTFYYTEYWLTMQLDKVTDAALASELLEQGVNFGPVVAISHLQEALARLGIKLGIDGRMGPATLAAANNYPDKQRLIRVLDGIQFCTYCHIVDGDASQAGNFIGWLRRIGSL